MNPTTEQRELLELAANAAGLVDDWPAPHYEIQWNGNGLWCSGLGNGALWNPLTDDGDALRLAVKLGLILNLSQRVDCRGATVVTFHGLSKIEEPCYEGREQAARRAIVRAAAAIAKGEK